MKTLIIYDTTYGNTEKIARAAGAALSGDVEVVRAGEAGNLDLESVDLLIIGSPTQGFRPCQPVQLFIDNLPGSVLKNAGIAVFDTRMGERDVGAGLRFVMKMGGYAAPRMARAVEKKGGRLAAAPEGFIVKGREGPLKEGELERAAAWAKGIMSTIAKPARK